MDALPDKDKELIVVGDFNVWDCVTKLNGNLLNFVDQTDCLIFGQNLRLKAKQPRCLKRKMCSKNMSITLFVKIFARTNFRAFLRRTSICAKLHENWYRNFEVLWQVRKNISARKFFHTIFLYFVSVAIYHVSGKHPM